MRLQLLSQIKELLGCAGGGQDGPCNGFAVDSRFVEEGQVFIALPGAKTDGHSFLGEAAGKGAAAAIVRKNYESENYGLSLIRVDNTMEALQDLARQVLAGRNRQKVVGVTGSVGKTTTKEFTAALLRSELNVKANTGNRNSQIGLPLTILNETDGSEDVLVLEMAMTHPGNIEKLVSIAPPDLALITLVAPVHISYFDSLHGIAEAKAEILRHPKTKQSIIPLDSEFCDYFRKKGPCAKLTFSVRDAAADYYLSDTNAGVSVRHQGRTVQFGPLPVTGKHNRYNFLAAVSIARELGVSWEALQEAATRLVLPDLRLQRVEKEGIVFINDSYNAGVLSMKAALNSLPIPSKGKRKIAVFGEMLELGKLTQESHREVGEYALERVDQVLCVGKGCVDLVDVWSQAGRQAGFYASRDELVRGLKTIAEPGDIVLLKGSRGNELWKILDAFES